jgi:hypothetical protein
MDKQLRIIAGAIVSESKLNKEAKLQLLNFIQKEATDTQVKALLLDGKILAKIDEQTEEIIEERFEILREKNWLLSEDAGATALAVIFLGGVSLAVTTTIWRMYRHIRGAVDEKSRRCGTYSIGSDRKACLLTVKMDEANELVKMLQKGIGDCSKQKDPSKCKAKFKQAIIKQKEKAEKFKTKLNKMAAKGKEVAQGQERARRKGTHITY